jgi:hypothetical protein
MTRFSRRSHPRDEAGSALVLALLFLTVCGVIIGGLLTYSNANSTSTGALRLARGYDYDAVAAMNAGIANVRMGNTCGTGATGYEPTWTLNVPSRPLRVDCFPQTSSSVKREDVFLVCPSSVSAPCPDSSALLRSEVTFYDSQGTGKTLEVNTWSNE